MLQEKLNQLNFTHKSFGERAGISQSYVTRLAKGDRELSLEKYPQVAAALGMTSVELFKMFISKYEKSN